MRINVESCFDFFVPEAFAYKERSDVHLDKKRSVGVAEVVYADPFYARFFASDLHVIGKFVGSERKDAGVGVDMAFGAQIKRDLFRERRIKRNCTLAFPGLGIADEIGLVIATICL